MKLTHGKHQGEGQIYSLFLGALSIILSILDISEKFTNINILAATNRNPSYPKNPLIFITIFSAKKPD